MLANRPVATSASDLHAADAIACARSIGLDDFADDIVTALRGDNLAVTRTTIARMARQANDWADGRGARMVLDDLASHMDDLVEAIDAELLALCAESAS